MLSSLSELLSVQNYIPHGVCLLWQPGLLWLHVLSDATIAIAYYTIPLALVYFVSRRHDLAFRGIFVLTSAFILACGTTHVMGVVTLWYPAYWTDGIIKLVTALASIGTAIVIWQAMPVALTIPSTEQLRKQKSCSDMRSASGNVPKRHFATRMPSSSAVSQRAPPSLRGKSRSGGAPKKHCAPARSDGAACSKPLRSALP